MADAQQERAEHLARRINMAAQEWYELGRVVESLSNLPMNSPLFRTAVMASQQKYKQLLSLPRFCKYVYGWWNPLLVG